MDVLNGATDAVRTSVDLNRNVTLHSPISVYGGNKNAPFA